jgi:hypothetical protein
VPTARGLTQGPRASGVYARISADGSSIVLLDARGKASRTLGAGAGLVAAVRPSGESPMWVITGTDATGVERAAQALNATTLHNHFAVALGASGEVIALPQGS